MKLRQALRRKLQNKSGFTLGELMVTTLILLLSTMLVTQCMEVGVRQFFSRTQHSEADILCGSISDFLQDELTYASDVVLADDGSVKSYTSHKVGQGATLEIYDSNAGADTSPVSVVGAAISDASSKGYLVIDADFYREQGAWDYYYPVTKSSYDINSGSNGVLLAAVSVKADADSNKKPTAYHVEVQIYSASNSAAPLASNAFLVGGSASASRSGSAAYQLKDFLVTLSFNGEAENLLTGEDASANISSLESYGFSLVEGAYRKTVTEGESVEIPALSLGDKTSEYILSWVYAGNTYQSRESIVVSDNMTISCDLTQIQKYNLSFVAYVNGESEPPTYITVSGTPKFAPREFVSSAWIPASNAVPNYDIVGWYDAGNTDEGSSGSKTNPYSVPLISFRMPNRNSDVTMVAVLERVKHTITFDPNGGVLTEYDGTTINKSDRYPTLQEEGEIVKTPEVSWTDGPSFEGWYILDYGSTDPWTNLVDSDTKVEDDVTYTARWTATVTFDANGGTMSSGEEKEEVKEDYDSEITLPGLPDRTVDGNTYVFQGWRDGDDLDGDLLEAGDTYHVTKDITLQAQWLTPYTIKFHNGKEDKATGVLWSDLKTVILTDGSVKSLTHIGDENEDYWTFVGWYTKDGKEVPIDTKSRSASPYTSSEVLTGYFPAESTTLDVYAVYKNLVPIYTKTTALEANSTYLILGSDGSSTNTDGLELYNYYGNYYVTAGDVEISKYKLYSTGLSEVSNAFVLDKDAYAIMQWTTGTLITNNGNTGYYLVNNNRRLTGDNNSLNSSTTDTGVWSYSTAYNRLTVAKTRNGKTNNYYMYYYPEAYYYSDRFGSSNNSSYRSSVYIWKLAYKKDEARSFNGAFD